MGTSTKLTVLTVSLGLLLATGTLGACSSEVSAPEPALGAVRAKLVKLESPTTVEAGAVQPRDATCPGRALPDQCGSWAGVELNATRQFFRPFGNDEARHCLCQPIDFQIPASLPVVEGRAGWDWDKAELSFRRASGKVVECRYRGNANPLGGHFGIPVGGDAYVFERCSDGSKAGQSARSDWFELELGHGHPLAGPVEVALRLGEPDVVDGTRQEQVFYATDPRIAGAALHVPRGTAPPGETFSLERVSQLPASTTIGNGGDPVTTLGYGIDVHSDATDSFVFTPVPGAACPRLELPYDPAALAAVLGAGREDAIEAFHVTTLTGLSTGASVLEPTGPVTVNRAAHTVSFCVQHLSIYIDAGAALRADLTEASIRSSGTQFGALGVTNLLGDDLPQLNAGETYELSLTFRNNGTAKWDGSVAGVGAVRLVPIESFSSANPPVATALTTTSPWALKTPTPWSVAPHALTSSNLTAVGPPSGGTFKTGTVTFDITAPEAAAKLSFCLRSGTTFFGTCFTWDPADAANPGTTPAPISTERDCYTGPAGTEGRGNCHHGTQQRSGGAWGGCEGEVTPAASDPCGNGNEDCDDRTDEDDNTYYLDRDGDGFGDPASTFTGCSPPAGYIASAGDCCDTEGNAHPGQTSLFGSARNGCGGYDYDCDGAESKFNEFIGAERSCNANNVCTGCVHDGWPSFVPDCGVTTDFSNCGFGPEPCNGSCALFTNIWTIQQTQLCR